MIITETQLTKINDLISENKVKDFSLLINQKFQEYFSEFLMLFAAVTLGFFAENKREHYVEREREHHYMQTFYEDLKRDTTEMAAVKRHYLKQIANIDTTTSVIFSNS